MRFRSVLVLIKLLVLFVGDKLPHFNQASIGRRGVGGRGVCEVDALFDGFFNGFHDVTLLVFWMFFVEGVQLRTVHCVRIFDPGNDK